jgi:TRAP-type C4-dicarboxylate transport system permease small subunit
MPTKLWLQRRSDCGNPRASDPAFERLQPGGSEVIEVLTQGVRWLLAITRTAAALFLISSVAINFVNIIGRYFFSVSIPWAEEIMLFLMVGSVFTGCCAVAWEGRQIRMDVMLVMLPPKLRGFFDLLAELALIATSVAVTVFAWPVITQLAAFDERSQAANFPLVIPQAMVPLGYSLMAVLVALRLLTRSQGATAHAAVAADASHT